MGVLASLCPTSSSSYSLSALWSCCKPQFTGDCEALGTPQICESSEMSGAFVFLLQGGSSPCPRAADAPWCGTAPEGLVMLSGELGSHERL